jgi:phosphoribosylanthranilate isomerase
VFRIKICGITTAEDAQRAATAGAAAIGLNFYPGSPRFLSVAQAREVVANLANRVTKVGVFVNADSKVVLDTARIIGLDIIQIHGDEPPLMLQQLLDYRVIKAFRCRDDGLEPVADFLERCRCAGRPPDAVLLDAYAPGQYGGTGRCVDWRAIRGASETIGGVPIVLAGGLTPANVARAIVEARPTAVDTASGVEVSPGVKDAEKMRRFVAAAEAAFQQVDAEAGQPGCRQFKGGQS